VGEGDRFLAEPAAQVRVDHVALDGTRPDERDLHHEVIEAARLEAGQGVHLRATLHLEDADGVGTAQVIVDRLVGHVERREVERHAACGQDVLQAVLQHGQHAEA
jgi:hypothetical protein